MTDNTRTYGGSGRHAIPGNLRTVAGSPDDVRKVLRRYSTEPLEFDTLDIDPDYVGRHRMTGYETRTIAANGTLLRRSDRVTEVVK